MPRTAAAKRFPRIARTMSNGETISLSTPSKMPCYSWSLPAVTTCPGAKVSMKRAGENAVCHECYATAGFYNMPSTEKAQLARFGWIIETLAHDNGAEFIAAMVDMIRESVRAAKVPLFRGHDSGDFFAVAYVRAWIKIAQALPDVRFWFPTRSWVIPSMLDTLQEFGNLPNVSLRPSALALDEAAPEIPGFAAGTTVIRGLPILETLPKHNACPATIPGNSHKCAENNCTKCWDKTEPTAYVLH